MFFIKSIGKIIVKIIIFSVICFIFYALNQLVSHKKKGVSQKPKQETFTSNILRWFYSDRHPQQKYYRNLYKSNYERRKKLDEERMKKKQGIRP